MNNVCRKAPCLPACSGGAPPTNPLFAYLFPDVVRTLSSALQLPTDAFSTSSKYSAKKTARCCTTVHCLPSSLPGGGPLSVQKLRTISGFRLLQVNSAGIDVAWICTSPESLGREKLVLTCASSGQLPSTLLACMPAFHCARVRLALSSPTTRACSMFASRDDGEKLDRCVLNPACVRLCCRMEVSQQPCLFHRLSKQKPLVQDTFGVVSALHSVPACACTDNRAPLIPALAVAIDAYNIYSSVLQGKRIDDDLKLKLRALTSHETAVQHLQ